MWALLVGESVGNFRDIFPIFSSLKCIFTLTALHRCGSFFFHHVSHFCLYVFPGHWDNGGNLVWESSKHMLPKHMIIRFCWLFFFFSDLTLCVTVWATDEWSREMGEENAEKECGRAKESSRRSCAQCYCPVCQSLEGKNKENWSAVAYHMSASLFLTLCSVIHSHSQYSLQEMCDFTAFVLSSNLPSTILLLLA